jgi:hypothetical protein
VKKIYSSYQKTLPYMEQFFPYGMKSHPLEKLSLKTKEDPKNLTFIIYTRALFGIAPTPKIWWSWWSRSLGAPENHGAGVISL